tara:strand:+ start:42 stop:308 length:267 start_codon:yes stop_codon:yes gene_type:complete
MIVEGLDNVTFTNDILRIGLTAVASDGNSVKVGELEIPKSSIEPVINGLVKAVNDVNAKIAEEIEKQTDGAPKNGDTSKSKKSKKSKD